MKYPTSGKLSNESSRHSKQAIHTSALTTPSTVILSANTLDDNKAKSEKFYGAAIIDESGREIPITESMIQTSLNTLIRVWETHQFSKSRGA